jgi:hypothetical protein
MAFKIFLNWPENSDVVMNDKEELEQIRTYLLADDRHWCTPSEVEVTDEAVTHESFVDWLAN